MSLHSENNRSGDSVLYLSRALIERAMEMRSLAYYSHAKHQLLIETIMEIDSIKQKSVATSKELEEMNRIKNLFIASMTHELSNPISMILGYSEMIKEGAAGPLTEKQIQYLQNVIKSAEHLKTLVADAMDVAKIETDSVKAEIQDFMLSEVIDFVLPLVSDDANNKNVRLFVKITKDIELNTDKRRLSQCLLNLLNNAIKYTSQGEVTIEASAKDGVVNISVTDTGVGLSTDDLDNLYQSFSKGGSAKRSKQLGSGIGLFLTNKLVSNVLHGSMSVQSESGKGSRFTLSIPVSSSSSI